MSNGGVLRRDIESLSAQELARLRDGFAQMQAIRDNRGYNYLAGLHGVPGFYCWHQDQPPLFLPWHRAYLYEFEQFLQDRVSTESIPWWNWTSETARSTGIPAAFSDPTTPEGQPNPLYQALIDVPTANPPLSRNTRRFPGMPSALPPASRIAALLALQDFQDFSAQLRNIHNFIHGWIGGLQQNGEEVTGGDMGVVATAAFDPIFYTHHSMVDRIWYLWQLQHGVNNVPAEILNTVLQPFNLTVADILDISQLGYGYAVEQVTVVAGS
jgi:tyrosinase